MGFSSDEVGIRRPALTGPAFSVRLSCVAPDAQRPQVAKLVGSTLRLRHDVVNLCFSLLCTHTPAVLALPCVTH